MADFEQTLREIFGDSMNRVSQFQQEQVRKLSDKIKEISKEAVHDEIARLNTDVADLRQRVAELEENRIQAAAEEV
ncbi:MAG TPA: hypothetical protein VIL97_09555 [Thermoanaerobaculia bacterium]